MTNPCLDITISGLHVSSPVVSLYIYIFVIYPQRILGSLSRKASASTSPVVASARENARKSLISLGLCIIVSDENS